MHAIPCGTSYMGLSYMGSWPLSQGPSPVLQVGSQQTGTAPGAAQVTSQTHWALSLHTSPGSLPSPLAMPQRYQSPAELEMSHHPQAFSITKAIPRL